MDAPRPDFGGQALRKRHQVGLCCRVDAPGIFSEQRQQWRQVDLKAGEVRLDPGTTKNLEGRVFYLTSEMKELLKAQRKVADRIQRRKGMIVQHVFFHDLPTKDGDVGFWSGHAIAPSGFFHA